MWTGKIVQKEKFNGAMKVSVEFTNGTDIVTEFCIPQDMNGFYHWFNSRIKTFNTSDEFDAMFNTNDVVSVPDTTPTVTPPTQAEVDQGTWVAQYTALEKAQKLADMATKAGRTVDPVRQAEMDALAAFVDTNFKSEYIDLI